MTFQNNTNYAFLNTLIRYQESRMLNAGEVERMIDAKNGLEAYKVLNDLPYASFLGENDKPEDFQKIINAGLLELKETIQENAPYKEVPSIIWSRFDFQNLKALLKATLQGKAMEDVAAILSDLGEIEKGNLYSQVAKPESNLLTGVAENKQKAIQQVILEAQKQYEETKNPILIDAAIDRAYFSVFREQVEALKNSFLSEYFQISADLKNIQMYLRLLIIEKTELFDKLFLEGGSLAKNIFAGEIQEFTERIGIYGHKLAEGLKACQESKTFNRLEKDLDKIILEHMLKARYITFGPEIMFAFFWIKENNAQIIRTIMVGKLNNIEPEKIRKQIKKLYQ